MEIFGFVITKSQKKARYQYEIYERDISGIVWDLIAEGEAHSKQSAESQSLEAASSFARSLQISTAVYIHDRHNNYALVREYEVTCSLEVQIVITRK